MVTNGLDRELSTMQDIAMALVELEPAARARVLRWLQERFLVEATPVPSAATAPPFSAVAPLRAVPRAVSASDELLSVEMLEDMFVPCRVPTSTAIAAAPLPALVLAPAAAPAPQTIAGMLTEFVAEFQDIAREWDDACAAPADADRGTMGLRAAS